MIAEDWGEKIYPRRLCSSKIRTKQSVWGAVKTHQHDFHCSFTAQTGGKRSVCPYKCTVRGENAQSSVPGTKALASELYSLFSHSKMIWDHQQYEAYREYLLWHTPTKCRLSFPLKLLFCCFGYGIKSGKRLLLIILDITWCCKCLCYYQASNSSLLWKTATTLKVKQKYS